MVILLNVSALEPFQESDVWMEENWDVFTIADDIGTLNIPSENTKTRPTDPLGLNTKGVGRRASEEIIQQLCPHGG